jgi:predicted phosphoribosyltransferase
MSASLSMFADRAAAGRRLGDLLARRGLPDPIVYALPRGGVPVAVEIGRRLKAPVDLVLVRKIGAPGSPELALGAVTDGETALTVVNPEVARLTGASEAYLEEIRDRELAEIERRRALYLGDRPRPDPRGRTVIVVDDGLATGATARAAARALRAQGAAWVIAAAPVAPPDTAAALGDDFDEVICLEQPERFYGVGAFYRDFHQLSDGEVVDLLRDFHAGETL